MLTGETRARYSTTLARGRRWRWALWLALIVLGAMAFSAAGRSAARVPATLALEDVHPQEPAPRGANAAALAAFRPVVVAAGGSSSRTAAPDPTATALVSGRVVDALGGPISGSVVSTFREPSAAPLASTLTESDGSFELRAPPGPVRVVAQAEGYSTVPLQAVAPAGDLTLALAPASRIFGRALDASGEPVRGVVVRARALKRREQLISSAVTDTQGRFRLEALSAGEYELRAAGERLSGEPERVVVGVADEAGPVELRLIPAVRVALEVERRGRACTEGWGKLTGARFHGGSEIVDGRVLFEAVPPGDYQLWIGCQDAAAQLRELRVGAEDIADTVRLDPGQLLEGRVLRADGAGAPGVLVTVSPAGAPEGRAAMTCRSGLHGGFACDGLSAGGYRCHAGLELQPQSEFVEVQLVQGTPRAFIELRLRPRAALVVSLEHAPAERLSGVRVLARPRQGPALEGELRGSAFHFDGLLLGAYDVSLAASPATRREVLLERDAQRAEVVLAWPSTRSISGVVLDEREQPVVEAWVRVTVAGAALFAVLSEVGVPALSDSAGRFTIEGLFEGRYNLRVEQVGLEGFAPGVSSGTQEAVIHVGPPRVSDEPSNFDERDQEYHSDSSAAPSRTVQRAPSGAPQPRKEEQP